MEIDERDLHNIDLLDKALKAFEETQNDVSLNEFLQYRPLFVAETEKIMDRVEIALLSTRFIRRFNPYRPINVIQNDKVLFRVPQLFVPIKDVSEEYTSLVNKFRSEGVSEIPKYSAEATQGLLAAIMKSQENVTDEGFDNYGAYIRTLASEYKEAVESFDKSVIEDTSPVLPINDQVGIVELIETKDMINIDDALSWK